ncbi:hypothetical protein OURE66S_00523 [Oligella ureolytica]
MGERAGYYFIATWGRKTIGIAYSLAITELILAPVTPSNTARGGGIIHPLVRSIAKTYDSDPEKGTEGRMGKFWASVLTIIVIPSHQPCLSQRQRLTP